MVHRQIALILSDRNEKMIEAWKNTFRQNEVFQNNYVDVSISIEHKNSILDLKDIDALVSPANSFGFMDGGIDQAYTDYFGKQLQEAVQNELAVNYGGELLVGNSFHINTNNEKFPHMIISPTMRVPEELAGTINVYLAMRATIKTAYFLLIENQKEYITVACSGFGTGVGRLDYQVASNQMFMGIQDFCKPKKFNTLREVYAHNYSIKQGLVTTVRN